MDIENEQCAEIQLIDFAPRKDENHTRIFFEELSSSEIGYKSLQMLYGKNRSLNSIQAELEQTILNSHANINGVWAIDNTNKRIGLAYYEFPQSKISESIPNIHIIVNPDSHGKGVGTKLLKSIVQSAINSGVRKVISQVGKDNIASQRIHFIVGNNQSDQYDFSYQESSVHFKFLFSAK